MDNVKSFVNAIGDGDNINAETHFNAALATKVGNALETKRQELAKGFANNHIPEPEDDKTV